MQTWPGMGLMLSLAAAVGCGPTRPGSADGETSASTSTGTGTDATTGTDTDTDTPPPECELTQLQLTEGIDGFVVTSALAPVSQGGTNSATASCGGEGTDESFILTAEKTSYFLLWGSTTNGQPLTWHIHAGDSCHGPELMCLTSPGFEHELMLEAGESVVIVADSEPELARPADGVPYNLGVNWSSGPPVPCQDAALETCNLGSFDALDPCLAGAACGAFDVSGACYDELESALSACRDTFCPDGPASFPWDDCVAACQARRASCETELGCEPNDCEYDEQLCADACHICAAATFELGYTGACELALPGPPGPLHEPYVFVDIGNQSFDVSQPGLTCGDPGAEVVWTSDADLLLCTAACDAFALAGLARVTYGVPPCE